MSRYIKQPRGGFGGTTWSPSIISEWLIQDTTFKKGHHKTSAGLLKYPTIMPMTKSFLRYVNWLPTYLHSPLLCEQHERILPPCKYCHHPWCVGDKSYHKALIIMFSDDVMWCDDMSEATEAHFFTQESSSTPIFLVTFSHTHQVRMKVSITGTQISHDIMVLLIRVQLDYEKSWALIDRKCPIFF